MVEKIFLRLLSPASQVLDDRFPLSPTPLCEGLDPPLLAVALGPSHSQKYRLTIVT